MNPPTVGSYILITWLPNPRNHPEERSCYIGSKGVVRNVYEDGGFDLTLPGGGTLVVTQSRYRFPTMFTAEALAKAIGGAAESRSHSDATEPTQSAVPS